MRYQRRAYRPYVGRRRSWVKALLCLLLAAAVVFGVLLGQVLAGSHDELTGDPDIMIILGTQVKPWGPSILLQDRLDTALDYLEDHPNMTVVVSGSQGSDEPMTEAQCMRDYLVARGVDEERVLMEDRSHNTSQNLRFTMELLVQQGYSVSGGVLIVSNGFHLARARMLAGRAGFIQISTLAAPASHMPTRLMMYVRESLALAKSFFLDR